MTQLPTPSVEALAHSKQLMQLIQSTVIAQSGWLSFKAYMELALYAPDLGYYTAGLKKFGSGGDFVTAPEMSAVFGQTLANPIAQVLAQTQGDILELGAGTGKLALDILRELAENDRLPTHYYILDVSDHLRQVQRETLQSKLPAAIFKRVQWLSKLPETFNGVMIGNEVLDAIPVEMVHQENSVIAARGISIENEQLVWKNRTLAAEKDAADADLIAAIEALNLPDGYTTEVCLAAAGLIKSLADALQTGAIIMVDYGFSAAEYYHPQRNEGTLMCHYQHYAHADPLKYVGLQDITAHVNFTQIAQAGVDNGLEIVGYTNQATFLMNCGILDMMSAVSPDDVAQYAPMASAVQKLLSPAEMGELFKVIMFQKDIDVDLVGFQSGDKTHTL